MSDEKKLPGWQKRLDKTRLALWRRVAPQFAPELLRDLYLGILGREPDADGLATYLGTGNRMGNPVTVITDLIFSDEFKSRSIAVAAPELARALYRTILGREPDAEGLESTAGKIARDKSVENAAADLLASDECQRRIFTALAPELSRALLGGLHGLDAVPEAELQALTDKLNGREALASAVPDLMESAEWQRQTLVRLAPDIVQNLYRGIFGRDPDPDGLATALARLQRGDKLENVLDTMLSSNEFTARSLAQSAPELARALHRAVIGRDPEGDALQDLAGKLSRRESIETAIAGLTGSSEYQQKSMGKLSGALVDAAYQGFFGHEPDAEERARASEKLIAGGSLADLLCALMESDEFRRRQFTVYAPELAQSFYRGILGRDADPKGLETYTERLSAKENFESSLHDMIRSEEFRRTYMSPKPVPHPRLSYDNPCWVFLHIEKTAGTAVQNLLGASFNHKQLMREHDDTLYRRSPGELSQYTVLAGHFNHDSTAFIPKRKLSIFTFIREPYSRLYSLYHFLRAHEKGHPAYAPPMRLANELGMADFYQNEFIRRTHNHWNHMTWVVMGQRQWEDWRRICKRADEAPFSDAFMADVARPAIRQRLREFVLVGLQEDFDRSVDVLFKLLNKPRPETLRGDHSLESLMENSAHFKRHLDKEPLTGEVTAIMDRVCQLDRVLYDEAKVLFQERLAAPAPPASAPVKTEPPPDAKAKPAKRTGPPAGKKKTSDLPKGE